MDYNVHAGHNTDGKTGSGAVGLIKESTEARKVKDEVIRQLKMLGNTAYDCTVDNGKNANDVLNKIVTKCNAHDVDYDVSIHFNSGRKDAKGDDVTGGVEILLYGFKHDDLNQTAKRVADAISNEFGYRLRSDNTTPENYEGLKKRPDLYVLRKTRAKAMLIECCFVDDKDDIEVYDYKRMAKAIVKGLTGQEVKETPVVNNKPASSFLVKVKVKELNIRSSAGAENKITGCIKDQGTYTIVNTAKAKDGGTWGELKSGAGWINISSKYVTRV